MADSKISNLDALAAVDLDTTNDLVAVVDTSATQTKKISVGEVLGNLSTLNAIDTSITATAVDVFVYDTSKDSDGGAWRKRCQHTSWYNETLNTATRGSRREFPAVAVIVAEASKVTIYDGDDPDLPMWMVFTGAFVNMLSNIGSDISVAAMNGRLLTGSTTYDVNCFDLIGDRGVNVLNIYARGYQGNIAQRNAGSDYPTSATGGEWFALSGIVSRNVNDVAMTVLPDAPTDSATGLPVPTIAVATDGGVSVIKDDGTVVDLTYLVAGDVVSKRVVFLADGGIAWASRSTNRYIQVLDSIPASDYTSAPDRLYVEGDVFGTISGNDLALLNTNAANNLVDGACAGDDGLTHIHEDATTPANGMLAYTTSTYNTGWMNGDIKGAFLADTDDTDLVATNTISDRSVNALTLTLADAATVQAVATGAELVSYTFAGAESVTLGSDISTTGALIWWEKVSGIWQLNVNDLSGGTDYVNGIAGTVSTGLTISGTTLSFSASKEMALARATATIPTAAQIAKIYEDEKFLFQDNAACTLYGASDAVTALAHDPVTGILSVGTSAGRSDFQGLRRVKNTTTAVETAISASGGLVVEE